MKKVWTIVLAAALMLCGTNAFAQFSIGGGFAHSSFGGKDLVKTEDVGYSGFYLGVRYDVPFAELEGLTFEPGALYYYYKYNQDKPLDDYFMHFLQLPLNFKYTFDASDKISIAPYTGPQFNLGFAGNTFKSYKNGGFDINRFDISWGLGVAFTYANSIQLRAGYDLGMVHSHKDVKQFRNQFHIGIAFLFSENGILF